MELSNLYYIAIVPQEPVFSEVWGFKIDMATTWEANHTLKSPPHITLHMPFKWPATRETDLLKNLDEYSATKEGFEIVIDGFGCFPPRVIYAKPQASKKLDGLQKELLIFLKEKLGLYNPRYFNEPFTPHMTIAHRNLRKDIFPNAWAAYEGKEYKRAWLSQEITLLKHTGEKWEVFHMSPLIG